MFSNKLLFYCTYHYLLNKHRELMREKKLVLVTERFKSQKV